MSVRSLCFPGKQPGGETYNALQTFAVPIKNVFTMFGGARNRDLRVASVLASAGGDFRSVFDAVEDFPAW